MIQEILISIIRLGGLINDVNFIHIEDFSAKIITSKCNSIDELKSEYLKANKSIDDFIKTNYNKDLKAIEKINNLLNSGNIEFSNNESFLFLSLYLSSNSVNFLYLNIKVVRYSLPLFFKEIDVWNLKILMLLLLIYINIKHL